MSIPFRRPISVGLWLAGLGLLFFAREQGWAMFAAAGACFALSLWLQPPDTRALAERGPSIPWTRRDAGEKFSIIMAHLLMAIFVLFFAALLTGLNDDTPAPAWRIVLAAVLVTGTAWQFWRNWINRNAR